MHRRAREILSSTAFLVSLGACGLLLLSWPLVTVLAEIGSLGQLLSLFIVWLGLVLGGLAWSLARQTGAGCAGGRAEGESAGLSCSWPPRNRDGR